MKLRKKLDKDTVLTAEYSENGIILRMNRKGEAWNNFVVSIEAIDGKPTLSMNKNAIDHYGLTVKEENFNPREW